jgi:hypothetical protein
VASSPKEIARHLLHVNFWASRKGTRTYAKEKAWIDSQIRGQWSGDRNWASGKALQTQEKEECTMKSVEALIPFQPEAAKAKKHSAWSTDQRSNCYSPHYQPTLAPLPSRTSAYLCAMPNSGCNHRERGPLGCDSAALWPSVPVSPGLERPAYWPKSFGPPTRFSRNLFADTPMRGNDAAQQIQATDLLQKIHSSVSPISSRRVTNL